MKLLLDTHVFIWWTSAPEKLSAKVLQACENCENAMMLSVVSILEMQIKIQLGKLKLSDDLEDLIARQQRENQLQLLGLETSHIYKLKDLAPVHRDPFDRLLAAQTLITGATLLSADPVFPSYAIPILW